jgi:nucleoid DNA-binding protein
MTKSELIDSVAKTANISKRAAGEAVDATFVGISKAIKK